MAKSKAIFCAVFAALCFVPGCRSAGSGSAESAPSIGQIQKGILPFLEGMSMARTPDKSELLSGSMDLSYFSGEWIYNEEFDCYALEYVVYCERPADAVKECMNIYVPASYMKADGSLNNAGEVNGYTALTAPIVYKNSVGGYAESDAERITERDAVFLRAGFVCVFPGCRGRETQSDDGKYIGKSPAPIADLKAGVRFLKANDAVMAGDAGKIISVGTSAGGAMSALLSGTGNAPDYDPYLEEIGAVMSAGDDVFASQIYCPITDLDHADMAYEWAYVNMPYYHNPRARSFAALSEFEEAVSRRLAAEYPAYINSLALRDPASGAALTLGDDGRSGPFYDYIVSLVEDAATAHLASLSDAAEELTAVSAFLAWDGARAAVSSLDDYFVSYNPRMKSCPAFDNFVMDDGSAENMVFGSAGERYAHFDAYIAPILEDLQDSYPELCNEYYEAYRAVPRDQDLALRKRLLNPLNYIGNTGVDIAPYVRIRVGARDADTSLSVSAVLALAFMNKASSDVDYALVWGEGHGDADREGELVSWMERITR